ncbi:uncharacterized protein LOC144194704 [Stigmatopora nigra]
MSTGDFQNKYTSFMEGVVKSTIAETTKLFETLVDELKEELAKVKTENEALKTTCRKMEDVISKWENPKGQNAAVQCELNPGQVVPVQQEVQPPKEQKILYVFFNNPGTATQETSNLAALPSNHQVPQPAVTNPQIVYTVTDPPPVPSCEDVIGSQVEQQLLIEEVRSCDDQVTSVSPSLEKAHFSQNQSTETIQYMKSPSPVNDQLQMAPCANQRLTPKVTQQLVTSHFQLAPAKAPVHKPKSPCISVTDQRRLLEVLQKTGVLQTKPPQTQNTSTHTIAAPNVSPLVPALKSQPSEMSQIRLLIPVPCSAVHKDAKRKHIEAALKKQDGQLILQAPVAHVLKCTTKPGNVQNVQPTESVKNLPTTPKQVLWSPSTHPNGGSRTESPSPQTIPQPIAQPVEIDSKNGLLQDALLLVEAMDQSKIRTLQQETVQDWCSVPETPLPVVPTPTQTLQSPPAVELSTDKVSFVTDATTSIEAKFPIGQVPEPQQNPGTGPPEVKTGPSSTGPASQPLEQPETPPDPETVPSKNIVSNKPQPPHPPLKFCPLSSNQISEVVSTVAQSQSDCTSLASASLGSPQREKNVPTTPTPPLVTSEPTNQSSHQGPRKKITIIICKGSENVARPAQVSETQGDLRPTPRPPITAPVQVSETQEDLTPAPRPPVMAPSQEQDTSDSNENQTAPSQEQNTNASDEKPTVPVQVSETQADLTPAPVQPITAPSQEQNTNDSNENQTAPSQEQDTDTNEYQMAPLPEEMSLDSPTPVYPQLECSSEELVISEIVPEEKPAILEPENVLGDRLPLIPVIRLKRLASLAFSPELSLQSLEKVSPSVLSEGPPSPPSSISDPGSETSPCPTEGSLTLSGQLILEESSDDSLLPEEPSPCSTPEEKIPPTNLLESTFPCVSQPVLTETNQSEQQDLPVAPVQESETPTLGTEMVIGEEWDSVPASTTTSSSLEQITDLVKDWTPQPEVPQPAKTSFLAQLEMSPALNKMQSAGTQSPGEGTSTDCKRKSPRLSIATRLHPKKKLLGKKRKTKEPLTENPKKARPDNQRTTTQQKSISVPTNTSSPSSPPRPKTKVEVPKVSTKNQGREEIRSLLIDPVHIKIRTPVVSLYRLPLKVHMDRTLISAILPRNGVHYGNLSLPRGLKIPEKSQREASGARKPLKSSGGRKLNAKTGTAHVEKKELYKQKRSTPETSSGNRNRSLGADTSRDRVAVPSSKIFRKGKTLKEVKTTTVSLRSNKDYSRRETRSLSVKVGSSFKKKHRLQGQSTPKKMAPSLRKNLRKLFSTSEESESESSPVKDYTSSRKSQLAAKSSSLKNLTTTKKSKLASTSQIRNFGSPVRSQLKDFGGIENDASPSWSPDVSLEEYSSGEYVTSPTKSRFLAVGQNQSRSFKNLASSKKSPLPGVSHKESSSVKNGTISRKYPFADVSQKKSSSLKNVSSLKKSKLPVVSPRDSSSVKNVASSQKPAIRQKESSSLKNMTSPQRSQLSVTSQRESSSAKNMTSFKKSSLQVVSQKRSSHANNVSIPKLHTISQTQSSCSKLISSPKRLKSQPISHKQSSRGKTVARSPKPHSPETSRKDFGSVQKLKIAQKSPLASTSKKESSCLKKSQSSAFDPKESSSVKKVCGLKRPRTAESSSLEYVVSSQRFYIPPVNPLLYKVIPMSQLLDSKPDDPSQSKKPQSPPNSPKAGTSSSSKGAELQKRRPDPPMAKTAAPPPAKAAKTGESDKTPTKPPKTPRCRKRPISAKKLLRPPRPPTPPAPVKWESESNGGYELPKPGQPLLRNQCGYCGRVLSGGCALESHVSLHTGYRPYRCVMCGKTFPDGKGLRRHARVHSTGRMHICQQCGKGFVYGFGLTKHVQMVHGKIKPFVCQICNKSFFTKRDVETHIRVHTGERPFGCHLCEKRFMRRMELNIHMRWHRGEKRHWCPYCGKGFLDQNNLKRHKYIHTGEKPHSCPHCPKHFTQSGHLKKHVKNVHKTAADLNLNAPVHCAACRNSSERRNDRDSPRKMCTRKTEDYEEKLIGTEEQKRTLVEAILERADVSEDHLSPDHPHIKEEEEEEPLDTKKEEESETSHIKEEEDEEEDNIPEFPLILLKSEDDGDKDEEKEGAEPPSSSSSSQGVATEQSGGLLAPLSDSDDFTSASADDSDYDDNDYRRPKDRASCGVDKKQCKCSQCGKTLSSRRVLKEHMRIHTGEKPFACSFCGQQFSFRENLKIHTRTHTEEKPFICSVCGRGFTQKTNLTKHTRTHTEEKPFVCSACGKQFTQKTNLKAHARTHSGEKPFVCPVCGQKFSVGGNLRRHIKTHTGEKPYVCSVCDLRFATKPNLTRHARTHREDKPYACSFCDKRFALKANLITHTRTHTGQKTFACSVCDKRFCVMGNLKRHAVTHTGEKPFACSICGQRMSTKANLTTHTRKHTGEKPFSCSVCDKHFLSKAYVKRHKCSGEKCHGEELKFAAIPPSQKFLNKNPIGLLADVIRYKVSSRLVKEEDKGDLCGTKEELQRHILEAVSKQLAGGGGAGDRRTNMREDHFLSAPSPLEIIQIKDEEDEDEITPLMDAEEFDLSAWFSDDDDDQATSHSSDYENDVDGQQESESNKMGEEFKCPQCDKRFFKKTSLKIHVSTHNGDKPFACSVCDKRFMEKSGLLSHTHTHTGEKPLACSVAGQAFAQNAGLTTHTRKHTMEKPFVCLLCGRGYTNKGNLTRHTRKHTRTQPEEKPFVCSACGKKFTQKTNLEAHVRTHSGEKPYACSICDKRFAVMTNLIGHTRRHTGEKPFRCSVCDKRFRVMGTLQRHAVTHTGQKPFACSICGQRMSTKANLTTHTRKHTGEKPFSCGVCDKHFLSETYVKRHKCSGEKCDGEELKS